MLDFIPGSSGSGSSRDIDYPFNRASPDPKFTFSSAGNGFFAQDDPKTDDQTYDEKETSFGLVQNSWKELIEGFERMRDQADENTRYKLLFLGRHGQGYHNLAIIKYGEKLWDEKLSKEYGNDEMTWGPDPDLTELGIEQAKDNNKVWKDELPRGIPQPQAYYVSPFTRAIDTMQITFDDILLNVGNPDLQPALVVEDLREDNGEHTCDSRGTKSKLSSRFPHVTFETGFTEDDASWTPDHRETLEEHKARTFRFLNKLFDADWDEPLGEQARYISITSHSGTIGTFLNCINHRKFDLGTGGMIPVIVKATRK